MGIDSTYRALRAAAPGEGPEAAARAAAPPCPGRAALQEAQSCRPLDGAATAFVLAALPEGGGPILWVQDRLSRREGGRLYLPGGAAGPRADILRIEVSHPRDVLWAMEEGAACAGLGAVVGEIHGDPAVLSFTATKRLALRAEASGVPVWLIRGGAGGGLSAARERWRLTAMPSAPHPFDPQAPGAPIWDAELFRARGRPPGRWEARHEPHDGAHAHERREERAGSAARVGRAARAGPPDRLRLAAASGDRALAADAGAGGGAGGGADGGPDGGMAARAARA